MIRGVGRGFISGWWGVVLIAFALAAVLGCWCCWCYGLYEKRRRRLSLAQHADSDLTLREDSPKFLKLLANKENIRRNSNINIDTHQGPKCIVEYSGSVAYSNDTRWPGNVPIPMLDD